MEKTKLPQSLLAHTPWEQETSPIWLATSLSLRRNLAKYNFPPKLDENGFKQTLFSLKEQCGKIPQLKELTFLNAEEVSAIDREYLFEHFLCLEGFQNAIAGQGFVIDSSGAFFARLNIQDHLILELIDTQGSWEKTWNDLNQIEMAIGSSCDYAFHPKFGYLTADPTQCGTALSAQAFLHLPALIHTEQLKETLAKQKEEGISAMGLGGTLDTLVGDLLVISNSSTLGVNEEAILRSVHSMAMKLMALEKTLRSHLQTENNAAIKDQVSRAFGLLLHSYQIQTHEALEAISLLKLALHLDWVAGITDAKLNTLFFQCRRAHLLHLLNEPHLTDLQEIAHKRAEFLHKNMQGVSLKIETVGP